MQNVFTQEMKSKANLKSGKIQVIKKYIFLFTHLPANLGKCDSCGVAFYFPIMSEGTLEYFQEKNHVTLA